MYWRNSRTFLFGGYNFKCEVILGYFVTWEGVPPSLHQITTKAPLFFKLGVLNRRL